MNRIEAELERTALVQAIRENSALGRWRERQKIGVWGLAFPGEMRKVKKGVNICQVPATYVPGI